MHRSLLLVTTLLLSQTTHASEWNKAFTDIEMFQDLLQQNEQDMQEIINETDLEQSDELFPVAEGEDDVLEDPSTSLSDTHITIKVDGVPVVLDDVPVGEWFAVYVRDAAERGFVSGYKDTLGFPTGEYGPADSVTIEQVAKMAVVASGIDPYLCGEDLLNETAVGRWSEMYIRCAEHLGWAVFSDGSVVVGRPATRAETLVTVLQAYKARISPVSGTLFEDVTRATQYGNAIETANQDGIVAGYTDQFGNLTGLFGPEDTVNRAQTAKIFSLAAQRYSN